MTTCLACLSALMLRKLWSSQFKRLNFNKFVSCLTQSMYLRVSRVWKDGDAALVGSFTAGFWGFSILPSIFRNRINCRLVVFNFLVIGLAFSCNTMASTTGYFIGNSLTWDAQPNTMQDRMTETGRVLEPGWHIRTGVGLAAIASDPSATFSTSSHGAFNQALANYEFDFVTVQTHFHSTGRRLSDDLAALDVIVPTATSAGRNSQTTWYVYTGWSGDPTEEWLRSAADSNPYIARSDAYSARLVDRMRNRYNIEVQRIAVGGVLHEINKRILDGEIPGVSSYSEFHRDPTHASYDIGRYLAQTTMLSATLKLDPRIEFQGVSSSEYGTETYDAINSVVWDVLSNDPLLTTIPTPSSIAILLVLGGSLVMRRRSC